MNKSQALTKETHINSSTIFNYADVCVSLRDLRKRAKILLCYKKVAHAFTRDGEIFCKQAWRLKNSEKEISLNKRYLAVVKLRLSGVKK